MLLGQGGFGIGAQFHNVSKARIYGMEVSTNGVYNFNKNTKLYYNLGYVYTEPRDADYKERNALEDTYTDPLQMKEKSNNSKYLKYRQKHTFKTTLDFEWKRINLGMNVATIEVAFQFMVNNLLNKEYSSRPMSVAAPRTFMVKMEVTF